jgi:hypothetical protein
MPIVSQLTEKILKFLKIDLLYPLSFIIFSVPSLYFFCSECFNVPEHILISFMISALTFKKNACSQELQEYLNTVLLCSMYIAHVHM